MEHASPLILLSAGGTGGHVCPAVALAQDLISRGYRVEVATDARGSKFENHFPGIPMHVLSAGTLGAGLSGKVKGMTALTRGYLQARRLLKKLKPAVVVGFGGYPSVPAMFAAQQKKIPTIIHEQNAVIGRANAFLAARAQRIALSHTLTEGLDAREIARVVVTGNPVRPEISALYSKPYPVIQPDGALRILIMGGSLGATVMSDIVPSALAQLSAAYRARLDIVQQCRAEDIERVTKMYGLAGIKATVRGFLDDVAAQLERAHLVISRSGGSTVAEVTAAGRPAIFVPMPGHADQQQKINAEAVADVGGAWVMTQNGFTEEALLARIETFLQNPETLFRAAELARSSGRPDAARRLGNLVTEIASGWERR